MKRNLSFIKSHFSPFLAGGLLLGFAALPAADALAVKAKPGIIEFTQPDGTVVPIRLFGDERAHYATTSDGHLLLPNAEGTMEYAVPGKDNVPMLSGIAATAPHLRSAAVASMLKGFDSSALIEAQKAEAVRSSRLMKRDATRSADDKTPNYTFSSAAFPVFGEPHAIVVLVEYQDYKFSMDDPNDYYTRFLNQDGFSDDKGTGSCREYFIDNSQGQFAPTFDLYGPILLKNNRRYYGAGNETKAHEMVVEAVRALDDIVDFSQYDHNNDGYVDNIYVIYANTGEADGGPSESVWPHSWELEEARVNLVVDGVKVNTYGCSNELVGRRPVGIGTFTHEFSHVMGLPDLYNCTSSTDFTTPLTWSVLDEGPYNNDGRTPPNYSIFERYSLGWMTPDEIVMSGEYELQNVAVSNKGYILTTEEKPDEFYLLESRVQQGWDKYIEGHGMLVWHVDFVQSHWDRNDVNDNRSHQYVELVRADNMKTYNTMASDPFPGSWGVREFSNETTPALKSWLKNDLNVTSIFDITEGGNGLITFSAKLTEDRHGEASVDEVIPAKETLFVTGNVISCTAGFHNVYDISGKFMGSVSPSSPLQLPRGLYIASGRKLAIK